MDSFTLQPNNAFPFPDMSTLASLDMSQPQPEFLPQQHLPQGHPPQHAANFICPQDMSRAGSVESQFSESSPAPDALGITSNPQEDPSNTSQPKKKRKSWGQVLPKPTTNLPPRKRAKTEEEKAQRKYERVQRNRHAAHMSRMRKQDEMENLKLENSSLKQDNQSLNMEIGRLQEEVNSLRSGSASRSLSPNTTDPLADLPDLVPSLEQSPSAPSCEPDIISTPPPFTGTGATFPFEVEDLKHSDAHSAAMFSQPWTPGFQDYLHPMIKQENLVM